MPSPDVQNRGVARRAKQEKGGEGGGETGAKRGKREASWGRRDGEEERPVEAGVAEGLMRFLNVCSCSF